MSTVSRYQSSLINVVLFLQAALNDDSDVPAFTPCVILTVNSEEAMTASTLLLPLQLTGWGWNRPATAYQALITRHNAVQRTWLFH